MADRDDVLHVCFDFERRVEEDQGNRYDIHFTLRGGEHNGSRGTLRVRSPQSPRYHREFTVRHEVRDSQGWAEESEWERYQRGIPDVAVYGFEDKEHPYDLVSAVVYVPRALAYLVEHGFLKLNKPYWNRPNADGAVSSLVVFNRDRVKQAQERAGIECILYDQYFHHAAWLHPRIAKYGPRLTDAIYSSTR